MSRNRSEQHPLYPSGEWEGFYNYPAPLAFKDQMASNLDFCDQLVTGSGSDSVGAFRWEGTYDTQKGICQMTKYYHGRHSVFYDGRVDENGIWGTWAIHAGWSGGFHIWPKKAGAEEDKAEIEEIEKPEEVAVPTLLKNLIPMKKLPFLFFLLLMTIANAQEDTSSKLFQTLYEKDSLMFNVGFNTCDISMFRELVSEDLEFYHDQSGVIDSKAAFIKNTEEGLCNMNYKARRELVEGSLRVFPLYDQGKLYGAVQEGKHRFYAVYEGKEDQLTSTAKFTHLWLLEEGKWQLSRVLSYDHQGP